jgi:hypothetical protein
MYTQNLEVHVVYYQLQAKLAFSSHDRFVELLWKILVCGKFITLTISRPQPLLQTSIQGGSNF